MKKSNINLKISKYGTVCGAMLSLLYILGILATGSIDALSNKLGFLGFPIFLVQWISWVLGGWILAIISTIIFLFIFGFLIGSILAYLIKKIK